jgi:hypothetical protein
MHFSRPKITVPPLALEVKLAAINAMLDKNKKPPAKQVSSPHVVLSPHHPDHGHSYVNVCGDWDWKWHTVRLDPSWNESCMFLTFSTVEQGRYYLLDVTVYTPFTPMDIHPSGQDWRYWIGSENDSLRSHEGHLLYPFIGSGSHFTIQLNPPPALMSAASGAGLS